jgi:hypothetical protein
LDFSSSKSAGKSRHCLALYIVNIVAHGAAYPQVLRERTQQPEAYLKEVLSEIAVLTRSGEFSGTWELKPNFREEGVSLDSDLEADSFTNKARTAD